MVEKLIAMAAMIVSGAASGQSAVMLFGAIDTTLAHGSGSLSSKTQLTSGGSTASRLGFRGTEDFGGGTSASFWFEAGFNSDTGTGRATNINNQPSGATPAGGLTFNRRSTVSLAGSWGELRIGRDYTPQFRNQDNANLAIGSGSSLIEDATVIGPTAVRASNSIAYLYNTSGWVDGPGLYGTLMYYMGENSSYGARKKDGNGAGLRVGYKFGPADVAIALSRTKYLAGNQSQNNIGASWKFDAARLMAVYEWDKNDALIGGSTAKGYSIGVDIPVGAGQIYLLHSRYRVEQITEAVNRPASRKYSLAYIHHLSKRTALYGGYAYVANRGGAALALNGAMTGANASSSGSDLGIRHSF